ncbi:MAG TPA: efflux RND transporter permease subunit [Bacillota bacterium]|nr:efflux RND transporter permease subunit [Bacillota bacterium]
MEKLIKLCVRRPIGVLIVTLFVALIGLVSLSMLKYDLYPNITFPIILTSTSYEGVGPEEMETLVTRPLEAAISAVPNVKKVSSTSSNGSSMIIAEFNFGTNMDFASLKVRERIDMVKRYLPEDVQNPIIFKYDPSMMPIVFLGMSSKKGLVETTRLANDKVKPRLERIPGVASVQVIGGLEREIKVLLSADKLAFYKVSPTYIAQSLQGENLNLPGGTVDQSRNELTIRTIGEFQSVEELQRLKINLPGGSVIPLQELAEIKDSYHDQNQISRINGGASAMVMIMKESDANTVLVTREVRKALEQLKNDLSGQASIQKVFEQSEFIENAINDVINNAVSGAILAIIILYLFLRNIRSTMVISITIPISIIVTFAMIYFSKMTLNLVSMGGLALGIGNLVDNAIVVLESIHRYREEGHGPIDAAIKGTSEVGLAITASTCTTIVVFAPVLFIDNMAAQIFKELAYTVSFSQVASLIAALTMIPLLASKLIKFKPGKTSKVTETPGKEYQLGKIEAIYRSMLSWAVQHRPTVVLIAVLIFVLGFVPFFLGIKMEFMSSMGQKEYTVEFELPLGTNLETTNQVARRIEAYLQRQPNTEMVFAMVGSGSNFGFGGSDGQSEKGTVYVMMDKKCAKSIEELTEEARQGLTGMPGVKISVKEESHDPGGGSQKPITINIEGPEINVLQNLSGQIKEIVQSVPNTREVDTSWQTGRPELQLHINRERANAFGLTASSIANTIQTCFKGTTATKIRLAGEEYDVLLQLREEERKTQADLSKLYLFTSQGTPVQLSEVVQIVPAKGPTEIKRENQTRQVQVTASMLGGDLKKTSDAIEKRIKDEIVFPNTYSYSMGGEIKDMQESNQALAIAFLLAVVFVYMVIAIQYENLIHPLAIMGTLPLSLFGITWSLYLTGRTFNVSAFIGVIMLAGIVVNNAIVLVDYIETLRDRGLTRSEAILKAGPVRLRPVLMTTLCTVLGLVPLALGFGEGAAMNTSMATVVIGGLTFCTLLTLVIIPVVYSLLDDLAGWTKRKIFHKTALEYHR